MFDAYEQTAEHGVIGWDDYPSSYLGYKQRRCHDPGNSVDRFFNTYQHEEDFVNNDRIKEVVDKQPIGVAMYSNFDCLNAYQSGILMESDCTCSDPSLEVNHAVTIVGYGTSNSRKCKEYWIIKNSWGADWGESGHFKMCADRKGKTREYGTC